MEKKSGRNKLKIHHKKIKINCKKNSAPNKMKKRIKSLPNCKIEVDVFIPKLYLKTSLETFDKKGDNRIKVKK